MATTEQATQRANIAIRIITFELTLGGVSSSRDSSRAEVGVFENNAHANAWKLYLTGDTLKKRENASNYS